MGLFGDIFQGIVGITGTAVDAVQNKKSREQQIVENQKDRDFAWEQSERQMAFNSYEAEEQRQFLSKEAELAYERQQEFYDSRQSPSAMVQQYKEAGLNPMSIAGGSLSSSPLSSSAPSGAAAGSGSAPTVSSSAIPRALDLGDRMISLAKSVEEMRLMRAEARRQTSEAALNEIDSLTRGEINNQTIGRIAAETKKLGAETTNIEESTRLVVAKIATEEKTVEEMAALIAKYGVECGEIESRRRLNLQYIDHSLAEIENINADTDYKNSLKEKTVLESAILAIQKKYAGRKEAALISEILSKAQLNLSNAAEARKSIEQIEHDLNTSHYSPDMEKGWNRGVKYVGWFLNEIVGSLFSGAYVGAHADITSKPKAKKVGFK